MTAVAVAHAAVEEDTPLRAAEFERDVGFRVLRRFLAAYHIGQHAARLQEARAWAAHPRRSTRHVLGGVLSPPPACSRLCLSRLAPALYFRAQEQVGFDALLLCNDADLKELGLRKGVRVKILGTMRGWAASELARLS